MLADAHILSRAQCPRVSEDQPGGGLPHHAGGPQGNHQADQHGEPLEGVGVSTGQVGVSHGQGEQPNGQGGQPGGRKKRFPGEPGNGPRPRQTLQYTLAEGTETLGDEENQQRDGEPRNGTNHGVQQVARQVDQIFVEALTPGTSVGKALQDKGQPFVGQQQHQGPVDQGQQPPDQKVYVAHI
ncbi:hypothetical protein FQZ97_813210 [compost metagenome]